MGVLAHLAAEKWLGSGLGKGPWGRLVPLAVPQLLQITTRKPANPPEAGRGLRSPGIPADSP